MSYRTFLLGYEAMQRIEVLEGMMEAKPPPANPGKRLGGSGSIHLEGMDDFKIWHNPGSNLNLSSIIYKFYSIWLQEFHEKVIYWGIVLQISKIYL
jgi:hypothetical protein